MSQNKVKKTVKRKLKTDKVWKVSEFKSWLTGFMAGQDDDWTPTRKQWEYFSEIVMSLPDEIVPTEPVHIPSQFPINRLPQLPPQMPMMQTSAFDSVVTDFVKPAPVSRSGVTEMLDKNGVSMKVLPTGHNPYE